MPNFQFSEDNVVPEPPAPTDSPPDKTSKFELLSGPPVPTVSTSAPPSTPDVSPSHANLARPNPIVVPNPPLPAGLKPNSTSLPSIAPQHPVVPSPVVPTPLTPATNASASAPAPLKPRPAAIPIPTPAVPTHRPTPAITEEPVASAGPHDNFSLKIWSVGQSIKSVLDQLEGVASWVLRVALVAGVTSLAYILAATLFAKAGHLEGNPNAAALIQNLKLASQVLRFSLLGGAVAALLLGYEDNRLGFFVGGLGVALYIGVPIAINNFVGLSRATAGMVPLFRQTGYLLVMIGLVKALCDSAVWLWGLPDKVKTRHASVGVANQAEAKQRIIAREANMTSPCWKLPFCRESIRKQCPAFLAKKTCWKFGRGCYCDEEMISRIVRGEALDVIKAPTRQSRQGKAPCERCYIYLEHQTYKFRMISPLALPVTVLSTWLLWPIYSRVFMVANRVFDSIWSSFSFNSANITPDAIKTSQASLDEINKLGHNSAEFAHYAQNMFGVLLGFMLLIYLSKAIEWAIFKAKW